MRTSAASPVTRWSLAALAGTAVLMVFPLVNGFPFLFSDTGTYISAFRTFRVPWDRPVFYSIFIAVSSVGLSLWLTALVQALVTSVVGVLFLRRALDIRSALVAGLVLATSFALTSVPWFATQLVPDLFTPLMVLALVVILAAGPVLSIPEAAFCVLVIAAGASFHLGNWMIAAATVAAFGIARVFSGRALPGRAVLLATTAVLAGVVGIAVSNLAARHRLTLSASSRTFLFAKLLDDGPTLATLQRACPGRFRACSELAAIQAHVPSTSAEGVSRADHFLWEGPLERLGWFEAFEPEADLIVREALRDVEWGRQLGRSAANAARQFVSVDAGDFAEPLPADRPTRRAIETYYGAAAGAQAAASLQVQGLLRFDGFNGLYRIVLLASALVLGVMLATSRAARSRADVVTAVVVAVCANAVVTGVLSTVHDRYQSRVAWIIPLLAFALLATVLRREAPGALPKTAP